MISEDGNFSTTLLGNPIVTPEALFQFTVPAGFWFAAENDNKDTYSLAGCIVSLGFDFADFELANRKELLMLFSQHAEIIKKFTRKQ